MDDKEYQNLLNYTKYVLKIRGKWVDDPCDIISDAYVRFHKTGVEYSFDAMRKHIKNAISRLYDRPTFIEIGAASGVVIDPIYNIPSTDGTKVCITCKTEFPVTDFYPKFDRHKWRRDSRCKKCQNKRRSRLRNGYIVNILKKNGFTKEYIEAHPWIIQRKKIDVMVKRSKRA